MTRIARLPSVEWIFIHGLVINRAEQGEDAVVDSEGRWTHPVTNVPAWGYLSLVGQSEIEWAASVGVRADAVVRFPRGAGIDASDSVTAAGIDQWLNGTYKINAVRPTVVDVRCLLERMAEAPIL